MTCAHIELRKTETKVWDWEEGEYRTHVEWSEWSTEEDLDLHRTKCSQCGHIGYYSSAARKFYEEGVQTPGVPGLDGTYGAAAGKEA